MQIEVVVEGHDVPALIQVYAEYKVFSRLAPMAREVAAVRIVIVRSPRTGAVTCAVSADLGPAGCVRARTRHAHPAGAIDSAAERIAASAAKRLPNVPVC